MKVEWLSGTTAIDWDLMPFLVLVSGVACRRLSSLEKATTAIRAKGNDRDRVGPETRA